jgi:hypothetical protein
MYFLANQAVEKLKGGGVKIENLALIYKKCRGEGVKSEKVVKKRIFNVKSEIFFIHDP